MFESFDKDLFVMCIDRGWSQGYIYSHRALSPVLYTHNVMTQRVFTDFYFIFLAFSLL